MNTPTNSKQIKIKTENKYHRLNDENISQPTDQNINETPL